MRMNRIPTLPPWDLLRSLLPAPSDKNADDGDVLTATASGAIYLGIKALGLGPEDVVLCPAYNCGHEVEAILRAGARVSFYDIGPDLQFDIADIEARIDSNVRAVLVTHFFGVGAPLADLRALCRNRSLYLIEDCAHLLPATEGPPGRAGDLAVFSLRKPLPLPDGGLLRVNTEGLRRPEPTAVPTVAASVLEACDLVQRPQNAGALSGAARAAFRLGTKLPFKLFKRLRPELDWSYAGTDSLDFPTAHLELAMSRIARRLSAGMDWQQIRTVRRQNFKLLSDGFPETPAFRPLMTSLGEHDCPLVFPVLCDDIDGFLRATTARGVPAAAWWPTPWHPAVPWHAFENAGDLKRRVCALPIHQDLSPQDIEHMLSVLKSI